MNAMAAPLRLHVAHFLGTVAVARWQAVDTSTKEAFKVVDGKDVLMTCAANEFPGMMAASTFYMREHRAAILRCHMLCCRANCALGLALHIHDIEDATLLARQMSTAYRACAAHRTFTGNNAHVLLGHFNMNWPRHGTFFHFGRNDMPSIGRLPPGVLEVRMELDGGENLMMSMKFTVDIEWEFCQHGRAEHVCGTVDVASVDPGMTSFFDAPLALDGSWNRAVIGRRVTVPTRSKAYEGQDMLCVLRMMEGDHAITRENSFESDSDDSD
eukprot:TRINITY_DN7492_c0_g1_i7.p1 TRINITY_DN7492_c0_g1~~TRINITY_DN7492_c0_g1_i7.p1  ORF type:complete len:270 (-),score=31.37 TRINITY_DN7492_c0_g1_i7:352-1161(-)